ncbi:MAG: hypothetical protein ACJ0RG_12720 [Candidatus Azotimanducaceae bacterium]|jgi:hypothetical protein
MKHLTLVILLALAPLSWGEDVYYCAEEQHAAIELDEGTGAHFVQRYTPEKFTLKYEAGSNRLVIKGRTYGGSEAFYMECRGCYPRAAVFQANSSGLMFFLKGDRFFMGGGSFSDAVMRTGTCTKF